MKKHQQISFFNKPAWSYLIAFFRESRIKLLFTSLASSAQVALIIPIILLIRYAFDEVILNRNIKELVLIGILIFALRLSNSVISVGLKAANIRIINQAIFKLRSSLVVSMYSFSRKFHTQVDLKILHARIVQDTERLSNMSNALVSKLLPSLIIGFALGVVLAFLNWKLLLIIMVMMPTLYFSNLWMGKTIKSRVYVFQRAFENFSKGIFFMLRYLDLTNTQSAQNREIQTQTDIIDELRSKTNVMAIVYSISFQVQEVLSGMIGIIILLAGGIFIALDMMTLGEFLSFYLAAVFLSRYITNITSTFPDIVAGNESLTTLYDLVTKAEKQPYSGKTRIEFRGNIEFRGISFSYNEKPLLNDINLKIEPGSRIALIGPNGCGKTTIINLLLGFYAPGDGQILAEGNSYHEINLSLLRLSIGVVSQYPPLFSGTIQENILYGNEEIELSEMQAACRTAVAHHFIERLPNGYNTEIGEDGGMLSGGERQRIAIARALIRKPRLLILDEPTNHIEHDIVSEIMNNIDRLDYNPSVLLISHDHSVVNHATQVYMLMDGTIKPAVNTEKIKE